MIAKIKNYFKETIEELKKVSWSSRQELMDSTLIVIASTAALAIFIGIADILLSSAIKIVLK